MLLRHLPPAWLCLLMCCAAVCHAGPMTPAPAPGASSAPASTTAAVPAAAGPGPASPPPAPADSQPTPAAQQAAAVEGNPDWAVTLERIAGSVVSIDVDSTRAFDTEWNTTAQATGFVVDAERGLILTTTW
jgi:hypothetical protein